VGHGVLCRRRTGPLAFLQLDAAWAEPQAAAHARLVYQFAQQHRGLLGKIGIIYNGNPNDPSDAAWVRSVRDHVLLMERDLGLHPDQAVFQSWRPLPTHTLPETSPDTLTSLVDFYVARKSGHRAGADKELQTLLRECPAEYPASNALIAYVDESRHAAPVRGLEEVYTGAIVS
jgi:hypothetical protein